MKYFLLFISIVFLVTSCDRTVAVPLREAPIVDVESISPVDLKEFDEKITLVLFYRDEQGDLGDLDPDEHSLHIKDSRLPESDTYHVRPITQVGEEVPVEGSLEIDLGRVFLLGNGSEETFFYTIQLKDREGNWSEAIQSPSITVRK